MNNLSDNPASGSGPAAQPAASVSHAPGTPALSSGVHEQQVWDALRAVYDPEIPVNIVDLGLVYDVALQGSKVEMKMTLTAQGCPMSGMIAGNAREALLKIAGIEEAQVEIVWDPPWHPSMITAAGREILGME